MPSPLSGVWGYLLIGEIAAVTVLSWVTVGIFLRRLRYPDNQIASDSNTSNELAVEASVPDRLLLEKIQALEAEKIHWEKNSGRADAFEVGKLKEQISYLENKLLSYEIVQEEISTLGELKAENERLKLEIQALKTPSVVAGSVEAVVAKNFSEFAPNKTTPEKTPEPLPGEISSLLTDIEKLSQK